jgi:hypothetical protein
LSELCSPLKPTISSTASLSYMLILVIFVFIPCIFSQIDIFQHSRVHSLVLLKVGFSSFALRFLKMYEETDLMRVKNTLNSFCLLLKYSLYKYCSADFWSLCLTFPESRCFVQYILFVNSRFSSDQNLLYTLNLNHSARDFHCWN